MEMLKNRQMNRQDYTNFESNLALMVIYLPVKLEFDWTKHFQAKSLETGMLTDRQTNRRNYTNFESNLAMMVIYLPVKLEFNWTKRSQVRVRKRKC